MKRIWKLMIACALPLSLQAQDVHFSQFYEMSILRNPALTGIFTGDYKAGVMYRSQWSSISKPYQTALVTAEGRIPVSKEVSDFLSVGLLAYYDRAGSINMQTLTVYPAINYNKSLEDAHNSFLSVGFTGGYIQRSFDVSAMTFDNQYQNSTFNSANPTGENIPEPRTNHWDLGAGVSFNSSAGEDNEINYFIGVAGYHFTKPNRSFLGDNSVNLEMKWNVNAGLSMQMNEIWGFQLHANYAKQGSADEIIGGALLGWNKLENGRKRLFALYGGVMYRAGDAVIPIIKLNYHDYTIGLSYDVNVSQLRAATNMRGGYELTVFKTGFFSGGEGRGNTICPQFW